MVETVTPEYQTVPLVRFDTFLPICSHPFYIYVISYESIVRIKGQKSKFKGRRMTFNGVPLSLKTSVEVYSFRL